MRILSRSASPPCWVAVLFVMGLLFSCASPEEKKQGHYDRGLNYVSAQKVDEAILEFRNVIQIDPDHADAKYQLALLYMQQGGLSNLQNAFKMLSEAVLVKPALVDAQVKLGVFYFLSNDLENAEKKAELVLEKEPDNQDAHLIQGRVYLKKNQLDKAETAYQRVLALAPNNLVPYYELTELYIKRQDFDRAQSLLEKALSLDKQNVTSHVMFARFYQMTKKTEEAEAFYKKAIDLSQKDKKLYFSLADFYVAERRFEDAQNTLVAAAQIDVKDPVPWIVLGDFSAARGALDDSEAFFMKAKGLETEDLIGSKRLAKLHLMQGKPERVAQEVADILQKNPKDPDGLFLKGRLVLSEKKGSEAADFFKQVVQIKKDYPEVHYYLGLSHLLAGEDKQARSEFIEAVKHSSENHLARLSLANLYLRSRSFDLAGEEVEQILKKDPSSVPAYILRGDVAVAQRDLIKAKESYQKAVERLPRGPAGYFRMGLLARSEQKSEEAKKWFEQALILNPEMVQALSQLAVMDAAEGQIVQAITRVSAQIQQVPNNSAFHRLRGGLHGENKAHEKAVSDFKKAIELNPNDLGAYLDLGNLYSRLKKYDAAIKELDEASQINPKAVQVYMLKGVIYEAQKQQGHAQTEYEKALRIDPKFAPAANNLAWIYAEHGGNIDQALSLAQIAKERFPDDPGISDTLGWILYKKNIFLKAISHLEASAEKLPENPVVRYHLGMAYFKDGRKVLAKTELESALRLNADFPGAEEAKETLKSL